MRAQAGPVTMILAACLAFTFGADLWAQPGPPVQATATNTAQAYILGPGDAVEIEALGHPDFKVRARIGEDGQIQLPYIGSFMAANRTTRDLGAEISQALETGGYFSHAIMSVEIVSYASRYVIVLGAVAAPGLVPVDRGYRLSEILARVGGVRDTGADYVVLRSPQGPERRVAIKTLATGDDSQDPLVAPGDKIFSPPAEVFYISGQVKAPGAYPVASGMTLRMAIARGGGLTEIGNDKGAKVTHPGGKPAPLGLDGKIEPGDVIVVGEKLF